VAVDLLWRQQPASQSVDANLLPAKVVRTKIERLPWLAVLGRRVERARSATQAIRGFQQQHPGARDTPFGLDGRGHATVAAPNDDQVPD
jgi:hypothetical protein